MARSKWLYVKGHTKQMDVYLRSDDSKVATLYQNAGSTSYRYRLVNYPHRSSKILPDIKACLAAIEKEVL